MNNYNLDEQISQLGIHELRTLAREFGVKSPTTKKRNELILAIKAINKKEVEPEFNNKFGRPVKKHSNQSDLVVQMLVSGDDELESKIRESRPKSDFREIVFSRPIDANDLLRHREIIVRGILRKTKKGSYYFLDLAKICEQVYIIVDSNMVAEHNLIAGDIIEGLGLYDERQGLATLRYIQRINGVDAELNTVCDDELIIPNKVLEAPDFMCGQSKLVAVDGIKDAILYIKERAEAFYDQGIKCIVVGMEISIETLLKLDKIKGVFPIVSTYEDFATFSKEKLLDSQNHAMSLFKHNKNVVVFVLDILQFYDTLDVACRGDAEEVGYLIRKTMLQCKASESASISVYGLYNKEQEQDYKGEIQALIKATKN